MSLKLEEFLIGVMIALAIMATAYFKGRHDGAAEPNAKLAALARDANAQREQYAQSVRELARASALRTQAADSQREVVTQIVTRPVYRNVCLDVDGLHAANKALAPRTR